MYTDISFKKEWDGLENLDLGFRYVLAYLISELRLIPFEQWKTEDLDECLEARFFGETSELHVFREEDTWMAVVVKEIADTEIESALKQGDEDSSENEVKSYAYIDRSYKLRGNCAKAFSDKAAASIAGEVIVREYIDYDEDGQVVTVKTRLVDLR